MLTGLFWNTLILLSINRTLFCCCIEDMHIILFERKMINYSRRATPSKKVDGDRLSNFRTFCIQKDGQQMRLRL